MIRWIPVAILTCLWFLAGGNTVRHEITTAEAAVQPPAEQTKGEAAFNRYCAGCHGKAAAGTDHGPSFINRIYEPNHHGDQSFMLAPRLGVRAHHWNLGDMPKIPGVSDDELKQIVGYIRWLQRQAGIQ
ncbi:MAG: cytochrome c [Nitrospirae bacterium]|nr:cytochrome c [Nitrospirota bacterium]